MMKKGSILLLLSQFLICTCVLPFFADPVHADTISSADIVGTVCTYSAVDSVQYQGTSSGLLVFKNTGTVHVTWKLNKSFIGRAVIDLKVDYFTRVNNAWIKDDHTERIYAFLNGDTFEYEFNLNSFGNNLYSWLDVDQSNASVDNPLAGWSVTLVSSNVTSYDSLVDLQGIIDILQDIYSDTSDIVGLSTNQLSELQSILQQCQALGITLTDIDNQLIDANAYLDQISKLRQYNIPIESLTFYLGCLSYLDAANPNVLLPDSSSSFYFTLPIVKVNNGFNLCRIYSGNASLASEKCVLIFGCSETINSLSRFNQYFAIDNATINSVSTFFNYYYQYDFVRVEFTPNGTGYSSFKCINYPINIIPVVFRRLSDKRYSTDFALQFGLSNQLLDDLHLIAQGTQQSNTSADNLEDNNDQMASDMDSLATIENGYNQDFNNQLQNIDFSNPIQQNSGLLPAANFVISVFNGMISNNPFSTLIIIVCILLIGKKVIGK